jgi:hypothetical protein
MSPTRADRGPTREGAKVTTSTTISISCDDCDLQDGAACDDCLVTFVLGREPDDAVVIDVAEARALRLLSGVGLVPGLRHSNAGPDWAAACP